MTVMRFGSVCSGIEAASVAWHPLGWQPVFFSEIERFPAAVLAHHYPHVPNRGDMTKFEDWPDEPINLLVGGTPCQSFSVAGLRKGLADPRGNLMLTFGAIAARFRPRWLVWENVPGVLSSDGGRDFGTFLGMLAELGYGFAYRVLDAKHFGVAQRRRRVFVVGYLGDWRPAAAVLFERESLSGHPAPRRETGQRPARGAAQGVAIRGRDGGGTAELTGEIATALRASQGGGDKPHVICADVAHALRGEGFDASGDGTGRGTPLVPVAYGLTTEQTPKWAADQALTLTKQSPTGGGQPQAVAFAHMAGGKQTTLGATDNGLCQTLGAHQTPAVATPSAVRRLTPRECERLQGFPDDWTAIPYRNKPADACPDGPRYKALGNSMAVPVMRWIGARIQKIEHLTEEPNT